MLCPNCDNKDVESSHDDCPLLSISDEVNELEKMYQYGNCRVTINVSAATHIGKHKKSNEDFHLTITLDSIQHSVSTTISVVADGLGGGLGGKAMAILAVLEIVKALVFSIESHEKEDLCVTREAFWEKVNQQIVDDLIFPLRSANALDCAYAQKKGFSRYGGAAICVSVVVCDYLKGHVRVHGYNEGDVRCLLVFNHNLHGLLSIDHGDASGLSAFFGKSKNINGTFFVPFDFWFPENPHVDVISLLIYSDGLYNMLSEDLIAEFSELPAQDLVELALGVNEPAGKRFDSRVESGDDNITVIKHDIQRRK